MSECNTSCSCSASTPVTKASEMPSKNKAIYRIENMDCPTEEALIHFKALWSNEVLHGCSKIPLVLKTKEWVSSSSNYIKSTTQNATHRYLGDVSS